MAKIHHMTFRAVLDQHRLRLARVIDQRGVATMKRLYDQATGEMIRQIEKIAPGRDRSFEAHHKRMVLGQLKQGGALLAKRMFGDLNDLSREAQVEAVGSLDQTITTLEKQYSGLTPVLPTADAARFAAIVDKKRTSSLLRQFPQGTENRVLAQGITKVSERMGMTRRHAEGAANVASRVITKCEEQMALSTLMNESAAQSIDRISAVIDGQWSDAERIVRTEASWASQGSARDAIDAAAEVLPSLRARWNEQVSDDGSYMPLDRRVAVDSIALHGQVADAGGMFTMPATAPRGTLDRPTDVDVPDDLVGRQWDHPPDRPNGREIVSPWRREWGIPGWRFEAGLRIPLV